MILLIVQAEGLTRDRFQQLFAIAPLATHHVPQPQQQCHDYQQRRMHAEPERMNLLRDRQKQRHHRERQRKIFAKFHTGIIVASPMNCFRIERYV